MNNAVLAFDRSNTLNVAGVISGTGVVLERNWRDHADGSQHLHGWHHDQTLARLQLGDGGTTGSIVGNIANNAALAFDRSNGTETLPASFPEPAWCFRTDLG